MAILHKAGWTDLYPTLPIQLDKRVPPSRQSEIVEMYQRTTSFIRGMLPFSGAYERRGLLTGGRDTNDTRNRVGSTLTGTMVSLRPPPQLPSPIPSRFGSLDHPRSLYVCDVVGHMEHRQHWCISACQQHRRAIWRTEQRCSFE